jgi:hypothetical protein
VPEHWLNGGHLYSIVHAFVFPNNDLICLHFVLFKLSVISGGITTELVTTVLVTVSCLCAFLCLTKQPEPFPSPYFAPFAGCNSLSAFTAIVEDWVPMHLAEYRYGRYGTTYNMVALSCFNDKLLCVWVELLLLPKNPTEAKLQATSTWDESTGPTKGVMKHTYKAVLYNYCLMQYCCILSYQLVRREGCNPNQWGKVTKSMDSGSISNIKPISNATSESLSILRYELSIAW